MKRYPIQNHEHWAYVCDPMDVDRDPDVTKKITCLSDTQYDPWFRKMIPWKWRDFQEENIEGFSNTSFVFKQKKKYPLSERYTSVHGKHIRLYKRIYDY